MGNKVVFVKISERAQSTAEMIDRLYESYSQKVSRYYNTAQGDKGEMDGFDVGESVLFVAIQYNGKEVTRAYLGVGEVTDQKNIYYNITVRLSDDNALRNICRLSELDLDADFAADSYLLSVESKLVVDQIRFILNQIPAIPVIEREYDSQQSEESLSPLAQRNEYCRRQYNINDPMPDRSEFQRDFDRIVHSKAFRRMIDKAQVFSTDKGDYYRTRMTHSQVVAQIARSIANALNLNLFLTEAIALGHDIGHTPFGHQGERTLDDILRGDVPLIKDIEILNRDHAEGCLGFKHNYQSLRVASMLEKTYAKIPGMDLSFQTLEGMLKHTKLKKDRYNLLQFIKCSEEDLHLEQDFCSNLEGQVVAIADEIAQRGHDLDDAMTSGSLNIDELEKYLTLRKMINLAKIVRHAEDEVDEAIRKGYMQQDDSELRNSRTASAVISYFIKDVIDTSRKAISYYDVSKFEENGHCITEQLIVFSETAKMLNDYLETIIANKVINNAEVSLFDNNASAVITGLFSAYYHNPRLLHKGTMRRLYLDMRQVSENVVDFEYGNHEIIREELHQITDGNLDELKSKDPELFREYKEKRRILVRNICDYISGMTDTYAKNEYHKIMLNWSICRSK